MYLDDEYLEELELTDTLTEDTIIFLKWTEIPVTKSWAETNDTSTYSEEINTFFDKTSVTNADYLSMLPSLDDYDVDTVIRLRPLIVDVDNGTYDENLDRYVSYATSKYYKVTD